MDPALFPVSAIPLNHAQYGPITDGKLKGINKGKVALVTGGARGMFALNSLVRLQRSFRMVRIRY